MPDPAGYPNRPGTLTDEWYHRQRRRYANQEAPYGRWLDGKPRTESEFVMQSQWRMDDEQKASGWVNGVPPAEKQKKKKKKKQKEKK